MAILDEDNFNSFGCSQKYTETSTSVETLVSETSCDLEALRYVWEDEVSNDGSSTTVGCLNEECCESTLYYAKRNIDLLIYFSLLLSVLGIANYIILITLITYLQMFTARRLVHGI